MEEFEDKENDIDIVIKDEIDFVANNDIFEIEEIMNEECLPGNNGPTFPINDKNLEPVIIVTSLNVDKFIVDGVKYPIDVSKNFHIGRNQSASIDVRHQAISRHHCVISFKNQNAQVKNLSSLGMYVNDIFLKNKNDICLLKTGDKILMSDKIPDFVLKYYDNMSLISSSEKKVLKENMKIINRKRKMFLDSDQNICNAKKSKDNCNQEKKRHALQQEKINLDSSFTEKLSNARKSYNSQVQEMTDYKISDKDMEKKTAELKMQFEVEKNTIETEYATQLKKWETKCLEMEENCGELKAENEKLIDQVIASERKQHELKEKLKEAEELIKIGREELIKENKNKIEIIEQAKQELEQAEKQKCEALQEKQEALKKCLENENLTKFLKESNEKLAVEYESKIQTLYGSKLELEKKIEAKVNEKNCESEAIINTLNAELDSVRDQLSIHENERRLLEAEVQSKISEFVEVLESEAQCTICSEMFVNAVTLIGCFHTFCEFCITEWKKQKQECPICRQKIAKNQEKRNFLTDSWIRSFMDKMPIAIKRSREEVIRIRAQQTQIVPKPRCSTRAPSSAVVGSSVPNTVEPSLARFLNEVRQSRRRVRPQQRVRFTTNVSYSSSINASGASVLLPSSNSSVVVSRSVPVIVNQEPIYVGEPLPNLTYVVSSNPIVISDEE